MTALGGGGGGGNPSGAPQDFITRYLLEGNDASLTENGTIRYVDGPGNTSDGIGARGLTGSDEFLGVVGESTKYAVGTGAFSMICWFRPMTNSNSDIWRTGSGSGGDGSFRLQTRTGGSLRFRTNGSNTDVGAGFVTIGDYNSFAIVFTGSGGNLKMYLNGVLRRNITAPTYNLTDTSLLELIGGSNIDVDDCYFYDRTLTEPEVLTFMSTRGDFQFSSITTISHHDPAQTATITDVAGDVSQIDDIGTSGTEDLVQAVGGSQMSTGLQKINGLNVLSSTTADRFMENLTFPIPASGNITISFVAQIDGQAVNTNASLISMDSATIDFQMAAGNTTQFDGDLILTGSTNDLLTGGPFTGPDIWSIVFDFDNLTKKTFVNGVERSSGTYITKLDLSQALRIFTNRGATTEIFGLFGEMVIHENVSVSQRQIDEGKLAWKANLQTNLDVSHPYKTEPPRA